MGELPYLCISFIETMKRVITTILRLSPLLALLACKNEAPTKPDAPQIFRERPTSEAPVAEHTSHSAGNLESLISDYENKDRSIWQKPNLVISLLGNLENKTVADIGAGTGYFAFRMVPKAKKVIGIDIDPRFITFLDSMKVRLPEIYRSRFESRLAKPNDPLLKPGEADAAIIVNTYGYIDHRADYLHTLYKELAPGGQVLIVDFKKNNIPVGPSDQYKVSLGEVQNDLISAGFEIEKVDKDALDYQYIIIGVKKQ